MLDDRFWSKVEVADCWQWLGALNKGYGQFYHQGAMRRAHRLVWEELVGPIPLDLQIDHLCRNRSCVNPDHMELVTSRENTRRTPYRPRVNGAKTHCKRGHPLSGPNLLISNPNLLISNAGFRVCLACRELHSRMRAAKWRALASAGGDSQ